MGGVKSPHFADWLKRTLGAMETHNPSVLEALDAIRQQGNLLATTNYDGLLLSSHSQLAPVTWLETDALIGTVRNWDTSKIIFLHGYWRQPESVILDWKSYDKIARGAISGRPCRLLENAHLGLRWLRSKWPQRS